MKLKDRTNEELYQDLIEYGCMIEANDVSQGRHGEGNTVGRAKVKAKAKRRVEELERRGINPFEVDYSYVDENGIEWELESAIQFI